MKDGKEFFTHDDLNYKSGMLTKKLSVIFIYFFLLKKNGKK